MDPMSRLRAIAADPHGAMTAVAQIEARIGRKLGDLATLRREQPDLYRAVKLLAEENVKREQGRRR